MSHAAAHNHADDAHHAAHAHHAHADLSEGNITAPNFATLAMGLFFLVGLAGLAGTYAYPMIVGGDAAAQAAATNHAIFAYHTGMVYAITPLLGCLVLVLIMRAVQAGWFTTLRRQAENIAALIPLAFALVIPMFIAGKKLFHWMDPALLKSDELLAHKAPFLNEGFFTIRVVGYIALWSMLAMMMRRWSVRQDTTGDLRLTNKAQFNACWGLLVFALSTAFAAFDLVKGLDYHFFSTMFGVYFFAGCIVSGISLLILVLLSLRGAGKLQGLVTDEHMHDLGKLLFGLNIFWAYVAFSQYFLIWYANVPEETAWYILRVHNGWEVLFWTLIVGHFIFPLVTLVSRHVKRSPLALGFFALLLLAMHAVDIFWCVRPVLTTTHIPGHPIAGGGIGFAWVDVAGLVGPAGVLLGVLVLVIRKGVLIPVRDPRLGEAIEHKNYV